MGLWRNQAKGSVQRLGAGRGENVPAEANVTAGGGEAILGWGWGGVGESAKDINWRSLGVCGIFSGHSLWSLSKLPRHSLPSHTAKFLPSSQTPSCLMKKGKMRQSQTHRSNSNILAWE